MDEFSEEFLAHHGIKGQKWGIRRTPEQLGHKSKKTKKKSAVKEFINKQQELRAAKKGKAKENAKALMKDYLRKHPKKLPKYARVLSREDVEEIMDNIKFDRKVKEIRAQEIEAGWKRIERMANNLGTLANLTTNAKNLYNNGVEFYNYMNRENVNKSTKPKIGDVTNNNKKQQQDKQNKQKQQKG